MKTSPSARPAFVALAQDQGFLSKSTLREQVLYAKTFLADDRFQDFPTTNAEIARFLLLHNDSVVSDIIKRGDNKHTNKGRIPALDEKELELIEGWIVDSIEEKDPSRWQTSLPSSGKRNRSR